MFIFVLCNVSRHRGIHWISGAIDARRIPNMLERCPRARGVIQRNNSLIFDNGLPGCCTDQVLSDSAIDRLKRASQRVVHTAARLHTPIRRPEAC